MKKEYDKYLREKIKADLHPKLGQKLNFLITISGMKLEVHAPYHADAYGRLYPDVFDATVTLPGDETDLSPILDPCIMDIALEGIPYHE